MIKALLFLVLTCGSVKIVAQTDTSAYQAQRLKVNALLTERSVKFGQYDESLDTRTGIFGFQTKGDIKKSNEILRQIVLNDNNIFKELKILMNYKDQVVREVQNKANSTNDRIQNYMLSIKKLQDQNQLLKKEVASAEDQKNLIFYVIAILILILTGLSYFLLKRQRRT